MDDDKYEPEAGLRAAFWWGLATWGVIGLLIFFCTCCTGCMASRYTSSRTSAYGATATSSQGVYGPFFRTGSTRVSASEQALDRLTECIRDRRDQSQRVSDAQSAQMQSFRSQFWIMMPPSWGNPSSLTDDHLLCLMLVSGADPGYAVSIARSRWQPGPVFGGYGYGGYGYGGGYYSPMGTIGAPGVR